MDKLLEKLIFIFHNVNDWLKFAEAKNAVLLGFSGVGFTATIALLSTAQNLLISLKIGLIVSTCLLVLCALCCSLSFLPKTNLERILWLKSSPSRRFNSQSDDDNFYYFGHLRKYNADELLTAINKLYFSKKINTPYEKECKDIATQITVNAEIAFMKFRLFTYSSYLLILSIIVIPIILLAGFLV